MKLSMKARNAAAKLNGDPPEWHRLMPRKKADSESDF